jgi:hypothetical protein
MQLCFSDFRMPQCGCFIRMLLLCFFSLLVSTTGAAVVEDEPVREEIAAAVISAEEHPEPATDTDGSLANEKDDSATEESTRSDEDVFAYVSAILRNDFAEARNWLEQGMDVDAFLPPKPPPEFLRLITDSAMVYYATRDQGVTALMMAAGLANDAAVDFLLERGANRFQKTLRNRTHPLWLASRTGNVELMRKLMNLDPEGEWKSFKVHVSLSDQKMRLQRDGLEIMDSPISSGKPSKPTPTGNFVVTDKHRQWKSSIYHVPMPYFVRLSCSPVGFHAGNLPGHPASSGCIRLPADKAKELFDVIPIGALVVIDE